MSSESIIYQANDPPGRPSESYPVSLPSSQASASKKMAALAFIQNIKERQRTKNGHAKWNGGSPISALKYTQMRSESRLAMKH